MRLFPPAITIGDEDGFSKNDIFNRAPIGEGLKGILSSISEPIVLAVDGDWGSGKTTFLKMLAGSLRNDKFPVVYFDSFENDYNDDAFISIASQIIGLAREKNKGGTTAAFASKALGAGRVILRSSLKVGVKLATLGALDNSTLEDLSKEIGAEASSVFDKHIGELLTRQKEEAEALDSFRSSLSELPSLLSSNKESECKPLIVIIDELDRCRPSYALSILERIKHFFSVPNVHFVLGINQKQLLISICAAYGASIDARTYLQKFVHVTVSLGDASGQERATESYISYLNEVMEFSDYNKKAAVYCGDVIKKISANRQFSLRTIERVYSVLALALGYSSNSSLRPPPIIAGLSILKVLNPELFEKAKQSKLTYGDVNSEFRLSDENSLIRDWWRFVLCEPLPEELGGRFSNVLFDYNVERKEIVQFIANNVIDRAFTN